MPTVAQLLNLPFQCSKTCQVQGLARMSGIWFQEDHFDLIFLTKFSNFEPIMAFESISVHNNWKLYLIFLAMPKQIFQDFNSHASGDKPIVCDRELPDPSHT